MSTKIDRMAADLFRPLPAISQPRHHDYAGPFQTARSAAMPPVLLTPELQAVLNILRSEPIRAIDGRYSTGFADCIQAQYLVNMNMAHIEEREGFAFFVVGPEPEAS
jgi:hypothetical protein